LPGITHPDRKDVIKILEIYKSFELITMAPVFTELVWRRRFSRAGEFQLTTNFTPDKLDIFEQGNIIYKRNVDEAAFIESRKVTQSIDGELRLAVRGRFLPSLLDRRIVSFEGNFPLNNTIAFLWNQNFGAQAAPGRQMSPDVRIIPFPSFGQAIIHAEYRRRNAYDVITSLLQEHNVGMWGRYNFDTRTIDISFFAPVESEVTFSKEFANIIEQDYRDDTEPYRNVVYVDDQYIHNDHIHTGFERREIAISAPNPNHWSIGLRQAAIDALNENRSVRTLSSVVNPFSRQFEYLKDWNIGSVVLSQSRMIGFSGKEVITEITEYYDEAGMNLEVKLGAV